MAGAAAAQSLTRLEGADLASLDVRVLRESQPTSPGAVVLRGISILPIEMSGHTVAQALQADRPRILDRNGFTRIELPDGGRIFRYSRQAGRFWGYLQVTAAGEAVVLLELAGTGAGGTEDPFLDRIAVANDGRNAVMGLRAGGLYVVRLDGATFASAGAAARFVPTATPVLSPSVMVGRSQAFFEITAPTRLLRLPLADGGAPTDLTPPRGTNDTLRAGITMSGDGSRIAFLSGPRNRWSIYLLGETGSWRVLPPPPGKYEEPGYIPEGSGHPNFLLNQDGSRLFYLESTISDETYLLDTTGVLPTVHITEDTVFEPTIGVHILPAFVATTTLVVAIGNTVNGVNLMDWFSIRMNPTGGTVTNLTGTGSMVKPFPVGTLAPTQAAVVGGRLLATNQTGTTQALRVINPTTGVSQTVLNGLEAAPVAGTAVLGAAPDLVATGVGARLFSGATGNLIAALPAGMMLTPPANGPVFSATWVHLLNGLGAVALYGPDGTFAAGPLQSGVTQVVQTRTGAIVVQGAQTVLMAPGLYAPLPVPPANVSVILSGAGA